MKIELKALKVHSDLSEETTCFSANLYVDGKKAGDVRNSGTGGAHSYYFKNRATEKKLTEHAHKVSLAPSTLEGLDLDFLIDRMVDGIESERWVKRRTRTKVLFRLEGDHKDAFRLVGFKSRERTVTVAQIRSEYGDKIVELH